MVVSVRWTILSPLYRETSPIVPPCASLAALQDDLQLTLAAHFSAEQVPTFPSHSLQERVWLPCLLLWLLLVLVGAEVYAFEFWRRSPDRNISCNGFSHCQLF